MRRIALLAVPVLLISGCFLPRPEPQPQPLPLDVTFVDLGSGQCPIIDEVRHCQLAADFVITNASEVPTTVAPPTVASTGGVVGASRPIWGCTEVLAPGESCEIRVSINAVENSLVTVTFIAGVHQGSASYMNLDYPD